MKTRTALALLFFAFTQPTLADTVLEAKFNVELRHGVIQNVKTVTLTEEFLEPELPNKPLGEWRRALHLDEWGLNLIQEMYDRDECNSEIITYRAEAIDGYVRTQGLTVTLIDHSRRTCKDVVAGELEIFVDQKNVMGFVVGSLHAVGNI